MNQLNACPCCNEKTIKKLNDYEICSVCGWEDDPGQSKYPDDDLGANNISLNDYKADWEKKKKVAV